MDTQSGEKSSDQDLVAAALADGTPAAVEESAAATAATNSFDAWELEEQLRHIGRMLEGVQGSDWSAEESPAGNVVPVRLDAAHEDLVQRQRHVPRKSRRGRRNATLGASILSAAIWGSLSVGIMFCACGGILVAWSIASARLELWSVGMPISLVGQVGLLTALLLQLDRVHRYSRDTAAKLEAVDEELHLLKAAATTGDAKHWPYSPNTHTTHPAHSLLPHRMLSELQSQLDSLAIKIVALKQ